MKISECIEFVDRVKPNYYELEDKMKLLNDLDGRILKEIIKTHEYEIETEEIVDGEVVKVTHTADDIAWPHTDIEEELFAEEPYANLYIYYLKAQIDLLNEEIEKYNNDIALFNVEYVSFSNFYNRTVKPLSCRLEL